MSDTLVIGGTTYSGVAGFKATDSNDATKTYIRPDGAMSIATNDTYDVTNYASAVVNVPTGTARTSSDLTANGLTVTAPAGLYASAATKTLTDANLVAGNIKNDVTIFNVTGTYEGSGGSLVITDVSNTTGTTAEISVGGSGGGSAQTDTGTFTGGGGNTVTISCSFAPDLIYVHGDLTSDPSLRGIVTLTIIKDTYILVSCDSSTSGTGENLMYGAYGITGYSTDTSNPYATYSNGTLTIDTVTNSGSARWNSGTTYSYMLVKWS